MTINMRKITFGRSMSSTADSSGRKNKYKSNGFSNIPHIVPGRFYRNRPLVLYELSTSSIFIIGPFTGKVRKIFANVSYFSSVASILELDKGEKILLPACFEIFPQSGNFCFVENLNTSPNI